MPSSFSCAASFAHVVVFPAPFTPSMRMTRRLVGEVERAGLRGQRVHEETAEERAQLFGAGDRAVHLLFLRPMLEVRRERRADVGGDQDLLELLEQRVVDGAIGLEDGLELGAEELLRAAETVGRGAA